MLLGIIFATLTSFSTATLQEDHIFDRIQHLGWHQQTYEEHIHFLPIWVAFIAPYHHDHHHADTKLPIKKTTHPPQLGQQSTKKPAVSDTKSSWKETASKTTTNSQKQTTADTDDDDKKELIFSTTTATTKKKEKTTTKKTSEEESSDNDDEVDEGRGSAGADIIVNLTTEDESQLHPHINITLRMNCTQVQKKERPCGGDLDQPPPRIAAESKICYECSQSCYVDGIKRQIKKWDCDDAAESSNEKHLDLEY